MGKIAGAILALLVVAVAGLAAYLLFSPPDLLRVATGYAAKIVCSNVFVAGRDARQVLADDVQAPGHPLLKFVDVDVDAQQGIVTAKLLGLFAPNTAVDRRGMGCTSVPDGKIVAAQNVQILGVTPVAAPGDIAWPAGNGVTPDPKVQALLEDEALTGPGMRAVVVVKDGQIVGEAYGPGFTAETPLLGWSMTKTVNAVLVGMAVADGKLDLDETGIFPLWRNDARKNINVWSLLGMSSGLYFNEDYGDVADVTEMLYLKSDMATFAADQPLIAPPLTKFNYSSGTGVMLSKLWMQRVGGGSTALNYPRDRLFGPLGMTSAVFEADEAGTFVGSSYLYATARDWARFGQFLLQDGEWNGQQLIYPGFTGNMQTSNGLPGAYSQAQTWMEGPRGAYWDEIGLPFAFWLEGHDGQSIAVMPSEKLVVVRLGLTPWDEDNPYGPEDMIKAVLVALGRA